MTDQDNEFTLKLGHVGNDLWPNLVRARASTSRWKGGRKGQAEPMPKRTGALAHYRRASTSKARPVFSDRQRVFVKVRFTLHGARGASLLRNNLSYVARGYTADEQREQQIHQLKVDPEQESAPGRDHLSFYDKRSEGLDVKGIPARWAGDLLHFRILISAEEGADLGSLRPMVREVMTGLERKLGTGLTWLAVDHWDTPYPHTHVLVRGVRSDGQHLYIPKRTMLIEVHEYAQQVVSRILGPRAGNLQHQYRLEPGFTLLDQELVAAKDPNGLINVRRPDLLGRLEQLEDWGFAQHSRDGWRIAHDIVDKLNAVRSYRRLETLVENHRRQTGPALLLAADPSKETEGLLIHAGIDDVFDDKFIAIIETDAGELRYHEVGQAGEIALLEGVAPLAEIAFSPGTPTPKHLDHVIAGIAEQADGLYSADHHLAFAPRDAPDLIDASLARLNDMSRMSLVGRNSDGDFIAGEDQLKRAAMYESRLSQRFPVSSRILSYWTLEEQALANGPTRLDKILAGLARPPRGTGAFASRHAEALHRRRLFLIEQGWLGRNESLLSRRALAQMAEAELRACADNLSAELGKPVLTTGSGDVRGVYTRRIDLAQGRVALVVGDVHGHLVAWRQSLEPFVGQEVRGLEYQRAIAMSVQREVGRLPPR